VTPSSYRLFYVIIFSL